MNCGLKFVASTIDQAADMIDKPLTLWRIGVLFCIQTLELFNHAYMYVVNFMENWCSILYNYELLNSSIMHICMTMQYVSYFLCEWCVFYIMNPTLILLCEYNNNGYIAYNRLFCGMMGYSNNGYSLYRLFCGMMGYSNNGYSLYRLFCGMMGYNSTSLHDPGNVVQCDLDQT